MNNDVTNRRDANRILDESFLQVRAKLLEIAAVLDRVDRATDDGDSLDTKSQVCRVRVDEAIRILLSEGPDRTSRLQRLFSREYEEGWRGKMHL